MKIIMYEIFFVSATCGRCTPTTEETTGVFQFNNLAGKYS
jgi:hypothetical protein